MTSDSKECDFVVRKLLRKVFETENLKESSEIRFRAGSEIGDGYVGVNSAIEIESENKILKLYMKMAPKDENLRNQISVRSLFIREIYFYETIYPQFLKFQLDRNMKKPFENAPKCYATSDEDLKEVLIFENLKEQGYVMYQRKMQMNAHHITFVFKLYADFHAISYAMKDQDAELYAKLTENLNDLMGPIFKLAGLDAAFSHYYNEAKSFYDPVKNEYISSRINKLNDVMLEAIANVDDLVDEYSVITHGDCWCNNFMFKYEDVNDRNTPKDIKILDWQLMRSNTPVLDLSYFFYAVAAKEDLANLNFYLKTYHDRLSETIRKLGSDPEKLYPYSAFENHWKRYSRYGLITSFAVLKMMLCDKEEVPNRTDALTSGKSYGELFVYDIKEEGAYKQRVMDVVEHFVYNNFI